MTIAKRRRSPGGDAADHAVGRSSRPDAAPGDGRDRSLPQAAHGGAGGARRRSAALGGARRVMSGTVPAAAISLSPTTPAATATVPRARDRRGGLGRRALRRTAARALLPRRLHPAGAGRSDGVPEQGDHLRDPVPRRRGDAARRRGRPAPSRRRHRRRRGAALLGPGDAAPPARPLHRARRWPLARWNALDRLSAGLLPVGEGPGQAVPAAVPRAPRRRLRQGRAAFLRRPRAARGGRRLRRPLRGAATNRR